MLIYEQETDIASSKKKRIQKQPVKCATAQQEQKRIKRATFTTNRRPDSDGEKICNLFVPLHSVELSRSHLLIRLARPPMVTAFGKLPETLDLTVCLPAFSYFSERLDHDLILLMHMPV